MIMPFARFAQVCSVVLDIGAFTGLYSLIAARANPTCQVIAFEPHPLIGERLRHNIGLNQGIRVDVIPYAVCSSSGTRQFHLGGPGLPSSSSIADAWDGRYSTINVEAIDVDTFVEMSGLDRVDLVKIDVEAAEEEVLAGMEITLTSYRPVLFLEVLPGNADRKIAETLRSQEYRLFRLASTGPIREEDFESADEARGYDERNHIACPVEKVPDWLLTMSG